KYAKNGGISNGQKLFELKIVVEDELTRIFKQAHQALWGGGQLNPSEAFDELDKLIFCKIWDERKPRKAGEPYDFQIFREKDEETTNQELSNRIKKLYEEGRKKDPEVFKDDIRLSPEKLKTVVGYLESINLGDTDLDSKGRAFETFMGSFFRGDFGQYFTPRAIVKFIVDVLPIKHNSLVLDTSCGSGGFLLHALDKIRKEASEYYPNYENDPKEYNQHYKHWHDFAENNLYGIEINEQIARVAKMNMIIHDDGHTNVIAADGLLESKDLIARTNNHGFAENRFDFIITNPPFGSVIKQTEQAYMNQYGFALKAEDWLNPKSKITRRESLNTEILFIEQCHNFLTEGGYLAIVLPDGILTNSSLQYVRDEIEERYRIVAVVSLPQSTFQATGAGVKSSILFLKKHSEATRDRIRKQKFDLQDSIKEENNYLKQLQKIDKEKNQHIKELRGFENPAGLTGKALTDSEAYKEWKKEVTAEYNEKIETLKETLSELYFAKKQTSLDDYPIFMAIAEDIGYDATGKPTNNNELDFITQELARFIEAIEAGKDNFFLSPDIDENKIFFVLRKQLKERLDCEYYHPSHSNDLKLLKNSPYRLEILDNVCTRIVDGPFGSAIQAKDYVDNGIPFIRVADITRGEGSIKTDELIYITEEAHQKIARSKILPGDVVIAKTGATMGAASVVPASIIEANIRGDLAALSVQKDDCTAQYIVTYINTNIGQRLFWRLDSGATRGRVVIGNLKKYPIIIPPLAIQNQIVAKMDAAYTTKKQKEAEAKRLLDSIDNYLLGELGIELPEPEDNTIQNRIFYRKLSDISGGRFDPEIALYNQQVLKSKFNTLQLRYLLTQNPQYGANEAGIPRINNDLPRYIRITDIDNIGSLIKELGVTANKIEDKYILKNNDLLIARSGNTVGKSYLHKSDSVDYKCFYAGYMIRFIIDTNKALPDYIFYYLQSKPYKQWVKAIQRITGQPNINAEEYKSLVIPLPPLEKQIEIAAHITAIRHQAKQLQQEAEIELEQAKKEVEAMILGEE
ncbi:MAG TPA: N-6 DNA methylase, partial [Nostocaceae cyanobacterium]|nr:N-6 DNA methylase [Nostocaceae cyanobacterium]